MNTLKFYGNTELISMKIIYGNNSVALSGRTLNDGVIFYPKASPLGWDIFGFQPGS
jgi:hypothetical protein